ncbi:MAG: low temperature requirement protein A [Acidimicrobiia bacterium]
MSSEQPSGIDLDDELTVSPLELFFDLVFVLAITQVAALIGADHTVAGLLRGALLLTMVYWGWSLYTWALNATGVHRLLVRLGLLAAMGTILLMAVVIPEAFGDEGKYFAIAYFAYRMIGTGVYYLAGDTTQRETMFAFFPLATLAAAVALAGGFLGSGVRPWVWLVSLLIDLVATRAAERVDWHMSPGHFAERYGLLVIVALGETVIAIGVGLTGADISTSLGVTLVASFVAVAALWWSYFDWVAAKVEAQFRSLSGIPQGRFARDTYTMLHLPLIGGIVLFSVALEEITAHPSESLPSYGRWVMAAGIAMVLFAFVVAAYRIARRVPMERIAAAALIVGIAAVGGDMAAQTVIVLVSTVLVGALFLESLRWKRINPEDYARTH